MTINHKKFLKYTAWMAAVILSAACICMPAKAAAYDADREGSITVRLEDIGTDVSGVEFYCYLVAEPAAGNEMSWELVWPFEDAGVDLNHLKKAGDYQEAAEKLASWDDRKEAAYISGKTDAEGVVSFKPLRQGVYLLEQTDRKNYGMVVPFLVSVPYAGDGGEYIYDVCTDTKGERIPEGTDDGTDGGAQKDRVKSSFPVQTGDDAMPGIYAIAVIAAGFGIRKIYKSTFRSDKEK